MNTIVAIFIGGGLGSVARFYTGKWMQLLIPGTFPYGTLASNSISSLILGVFLGATLLNGSTDSSWRYFIAIGFCGGYSTFSTFTAETFELLKSDLVAVAIGNITVNLIATLVLFGAGIWLGKQL